MLWLCWLRILILLARGCIWLLRIIARIGSRTIICAWRSWAWLRSRALRCWARTFRCRTLLCRWWRGPRIACSILKDKFSASVKTLRHSPVTRMIIFREISHHWTVDLSSDIEAITNDRSKTIWVTCPNCHWIFTSIANEHFVWSHITRIFNVVFNLIICIVWRTSFTS